MMNMDIFLIMKDIFFLHFLALDGKFSIWSGPAREGMAGGSGGEKMLMFDLWGRRLDLKACCFLVRKKKICSCFPRIERGGRGMSLPGLRGRESKDVLCISLMHDDVWMERIGK
jgi:hypothetical protein